MPNGDGQATPAPTPAPDPQQAPQSPDLSNLRTHTLEQAQAQVPNPQYMAPAEGMLEETKLGKAYGAAKDWLGEHEQHLSEKYLAPFRQGLDNMAQDLQQAAESGHTKSGGTLTPTTRLLVGGVGTLMKQVPVGSNVKQTVQAMAVPPDVGLEGKALSKAAEEVSLEGLRFKTVQTPQPRYAYRARDIGEKGVPSESHSQLTLDRKQADSYLNARGKTTGKPQELVRVDLNKLKPEDYQHLSQSPQPNWVKLSRPLEESEIEKVGEAEPRQTSGGSPTGTDRRVGTIPFKEVTGPPPEQIRLISEAKKQVAAAQTVEELTSALNRIKNLKGTEAGLDIAQSGGEKMAQDIRKARAAKPATPIQSDRWYRDKGAIPGEPVEYLDVRNDNLEKSKVAIVEHETAKGTRFEALTSAGRSLGTFEHMDLAKAAAESKFPTKLNPKVETSKVRAKPISFGTKEVNEKSAKALAEPQNKSRIVIEGIDEPARPEGKFNDRIKMDPFTPGWLKKVRTKPTQRT